MTQLFTNNATSALAQNITAQDLSLTLAAGDGAKFPALSGGDDFLLTVFQRPGTIEQNHEIMLVTARSADTLTVVRGQEGTMARPFNAGDFAELRMTAGAVLPVRGGALTGALNAAPTLTLASASSMLVGSAKANSITVTGNATINAFDTAPIGAQRIMNFTGAVTLTHNASTLVLLGSANVTTSPGDWCEWISNGAGKWTMTSYTRANGDSFGVVSVAKGGTGASDAATARANLGVPGLVSPVLTNSLTVAASGEVQHTMTSGVGGEYARFYYRSTDHNFGMYLFDGTSGSTRLRFIGLTGTVAIAEGGGNVVIGAAAEFSTEKLQVSGAVKASGGFVGNLTGNVTGAVTGNVTGNVTGSSGSTTGNAATATKLQTARNINGKAFDGTADITLTDDTKFPIAGGTTTGARPITLNPTNGAVNIKGDAAGWATGITASGSNGTQYGGFFSYGGGDACTWYAIGDTYQSGWFTVLRSTGAVLLGTTGDDGNGGRLQLSGKMTVRGGDSARIFETYNTTASGGPQQFYIEHSAGAVNIGNARGALNLLGNASTATTATTAASAAKLSTARGINGVLFDGTAAITIGQLNGNNYIGGGLEKPNWFGAGVLRNQMLASSNLGTGVGTWNDVLWVNSYTGGDVKGTTALILSKDSDYIGFVRQNYDATAWGTVRSIWHSGNMNPPAIVATPYSTVQRDSSGYLQGTYAYFTDDGSTWANGPAVTAIITKRGDHYYRSTDAAPVRAFLGLQTVAISGDYASLSNRPPPVVSADSSAIMYSNSDLNTVKSTGWYRGVSMANAPDAGWWYVMSETHDPSWVKHTATAYGSGNSYPSGTVMVRTQVSGVWGAWVPQYSPNYMPNPTMTGAIMIQGSVRGGVTVMAALDINCAIGNYYRKTIASPSSFTFSNVPSSGADYSLTLEITLSSGGSFTIPGAVWNKGITPTFTAGKVYKIILNTTSGGAAWHAVALEFAS